MKKVLKFGLMMLLAGIFSCNKDEIPPHCNIKINQQSVKNDGWGYGYNKEQKTACFKAKTESLKISIYMNDVPSQSHPFFIFDNSSYASVSHLSNTETYTVYETTKNHPNGEINFTKFKKGKVSEGNFRFTITDSNNKITSYECEFKLR